MMDIVIAQKKARRAALWLVVAMAMVIGVAMLVKTRFSYGDDPMGIFWVGVATGAALTATVANFLSKWLQYESARDDS